MFYVTGPVPSDAQIEFPGPFERNVPTAGILVCHPLSARSSSSKQKHRHVLLPLTTTVQDESQEHSCSPGSDTLPFRKIPHVVEVLAMQLQPFGSAWPDGAEPRAPMDQPPSR
ncbi:hypothetical protein VTO42DRAFT_3577 [Malbranchea cinnamomea]